MSPNKLIRYKKKEESYSKAENWSLSNCISIFLW